VQSHGENISIIETHVWHGLHFSNIFAASVDAPGRTPPHVKVANDANISAEILFPPYILLLPPRARARSNAVDYERGISTCSDLITSAALLDYIADLDLNYVIIETSPC
jgi:hypothetical protein